MSVYCTLHFVLLSCRVSSAPLSKLRLNSPCNTLKRYFILSLLVCVLFPTVHSPSWCSAGPCWSYVYISVWQNRKIVRLVWVFQILRSQTRENVRKWHSSMRLFLNVSHFARVLSLCQNSCIGFSKDVVCPFLLSFAIFVVSICTSSLSAF